MKKQKKKSKNKLKQPAMVFYYFKTRDRTPCSVCGYYWPDQFVNIGFFDHKHVAICAFCANEFMPGGLHAPMATRILKQQRRYFDSREGGREYLAQRFNRLLTLTGTKGLPTMITPIVRFSYANVFEARETPSGDMKFSVSLLLPKEDKQGLIKVNNAIQAAIDDGLTKGTFGKAHVKFLRPTLRDGDKEINKEEQSRYPGFWFFNANSKNPPGVIDEHLRPLTTTEEFYSGCWGRADVNFYPYSQAGNRGVGCGLNNLMKTKDDDRLDGRMAATDAFGEYVQAEEAADGGGPSLPADDHPFK